MTAESLRMMMAVSLERPLLHVVLRQGLTTVPSLLGQLGLSLAANSEEDGIPALINSPLLRSEQDFYDYN